MKIFKLSSSDHTKSTQDLERKELAEEIRSQLSAVPSSNQDFCICRLSREVHKANRTAYTPTTISIGPFHHKKKDLKPMEVYKQQYTKSFLQQIPEVTVEDYLKAMQGLEMKARSCYSAQFDLITSKKFKKMMFYDGCCIIQVLLVSSKEFPTSGDDPILSKTGLVDKIRRDLILLENQLPFFVLQCLFNLCAVFNGGPSLIDLEIHFFSGIIPGRKKLTQEGGADLKHLLDLLCHSYAPTCSDMLPFDDDPKALLYSASDLKREARISFKTGLTGSLLDIKFHSDGCMEIPRLKLQTETETLFRNLIAFEKCCEGYNTYIIDYICFMGGIIKARDDAILLVDLGIVESCLRPCDDQAITDLLKNLMKELTVCSCYYSRLCKNVNSHYISAQMTLELHQASMVNSRSVRPLMTLVEVISHCVWRQVTLVCAFLLDYYSRFFIVGFLLFLIWLVASLIGLVASHHYTILGILKVLCGVVLFPLIIERMN